jgi:hypothetical protein
LQQQRLFAADKGRYGIVKRYVNNEPFSSGGMAFFLTPQPPEGGKGTTKFERFEHLKLNK